MGFVDVIKNLDWSYLYGLIFSAVPALICVVFHEISHGLAAYALGDVTAKAQGRLSLNPLRHIDVWGLLMLIVFHFGWAKPVSVNMFNFKNPKRDMAITALAGPVSNIILASIMLFFYGLLFRPLSATAAGMTALKLMNSTAYLSVCLGIFNLIPIPPLDGSKVLFSILPDEYYMKLMRYERYGMVLLMAVVLSGYFNSFIATSSSSVYRTLFIIADFASRLL